MTMTKPLEWKDGVQRTLRFMIHRLLMYLSTHLFKNVLNLFTRSRDFDSFLWINSQDFIYNLKTSSTLSFFTSLEIYSISDLRVDYLLLWLQTSILLVELDGGRTDSMHTVTTGRYIYFFTYTSWTVPRPYSISSWSWSHSVTLWSHFLNSVSQCPNIVKPETWTCLDFYSWKNLKGRLRWERSGIRTGTVIRNPYMYLFYG